MPCPSRLPFKRRHLQTRHFTSYKHASDHELPTLVVAELDHVPLVRHDSAPSGLKPTSQESVFAPKCNESLQLVRATRMRTPSVAWMIRPDFSLAGRVERSAAQRLPLNRVPAPVPREAAL